MAANTKLSLAGRDDALDAVLDVLNTTGSLAIYDGTQPSDPDTAITSQVHLASNAMSATAWAAAGSGSKVANAFTPANALASGTTSWYSFLANTTRRWDGSCGTSSANLIFNSVAIASGANVAITGFTATMAA
jgi:hypothetical protein